jgi:hypothetical protein
LPSISISSRSTSISRNWYRGAPDRGSEREEGETMGWSSMKMDPGKRPARPECSHRGDAKPYQRCIDAHRVCLAVTPPPREPLFPDCSPVAVSTSRRREVGLTHIARGRFTFELRIELNTVRSRRPRWTVQFAATEWLSLRQPVLALILTLQGIEGPRFAATSLFLRRPTCIWVRRPLAGASEGGGVS